MIIKLLVEKLRKSLLARNTFWMLLGLGARIPIQAVYFILIARSLGVQGYGSFVSTTALVAILAPFVSVGSGNILIKNVSRDTSTFQIYWGKALALTSFSGAFLVIVSSLVSTVLLPVSIPYVLILSVSLADLIFSRLVDVSAQAFQAFQRLGRTSQLVVLPNMSRLLLLVVLLLYTRNPSPTLWGYFYLAGIFISSIIGIMLVNRELGAPVFEKKRIFSEMREGFYFSISLSSQNIYNDIDKTLLARLSSLEAAGIYGAAYRIVDVSFTPIRSLLFASYARFFQSGISGVGGALAFAAKLFPYAVMYGLTISFILYVSAPLLPFVLGSDFKKTDSALQWLALLPLLKSIHCFASDTLTGAGYQGVRSVCQLAIAFFNVALIIWLIPIYSWRGAAWASIASDLVLAIAMWMLVLRLDNSKKSLT